MNKNVVAKIATGKVMRDAEDFQPDAIRLENQEPPFVSYIVWLLILLLLVIGLVWASLSKVDKIVTAEAKVVTTRPPLVMKPLEISIIKKVHVKVGQQVKKNDILYTFDRTVNSSALDNLEQQLRSYRANRERLRAELSGYGKPLYAKSGNPDEKLQTDIYNARRNYYLQKLKAYDETINRYRATLKTLEASMTKYESRKAALSRIEKMMSGLYTKKALSLKTLLETQVEVIATDIQVDQQSVSIVENRQQILSTEAEKNAFIRDWQRQMVEDLVTVDRNAVSIEKEIPKYRMYSDNGVLRAPCNAVVHEIVPFQEGSAVREAEALVTLIPLDVEFEIEADIPSKDIGWVRNGDKAKLKFDAFPFQQFGTLTGTIYYISEDAFTGKSADTDPTTDDGGKQKQTSRMTTFQAKMKISGSLKGTAKKVRLIPGMRLTAEIKVGERSVLSYLFNPFLKAISEAGREP